MIENRNIRRKSENTSTKENLYATHPETHTLAHPSGRGPADRTGWRNRQKRGNKSSASWFSQWCTQHAATRLVLSRSTKNVLGRISYFWRGQDDAICKRLLRPLNISCSFPLLGRWYTSRQFTCYISTLENVCCKMI